MVGNVLSKSGGCCTCRSRGCSDTVCMACEQSRVWCRDTAPLCNLDSNSTITSTKLLPGCNWTAVFLTQRAGLCGLRLQFILWYYTCINERQNKSWRSGSKRDESVNLPGFSGWTAGLTWSSWNWESGFSVSTTKRGNFISKPTLNYESEKYYNTNEKKTLPGK